MFKSRRMRWAGNVVPTGEKINAYRILVGKPKGTRPLVESNHFVNPATSTAADEVHHDIIPQRLQDSIFNKLPVFMRQWEIQTC
jgi:hypothetical protein